MIVTIPAVNFSYFLMGKILLAYSRSFSSPVFWTILSSVWSRAIRPKLRPENRPERHNRIPKKITLIQTGRNSS